MTTLIAYAMIASGHLPLIFLLLLVAMMSEVFLIAASLDDKVLEHKATYDVATPSLLLSRLSSAVVHVASATGSLPALLLVIAFLLMNMVQGSMPTSNRRTRRLLLIAHMTMLAKCAH